MWFAKAKITLEEEKKLGKSEEDQLKREGKQELPAETYGTEAIVESSSCCDFFHIRF